MLSWRAIRHSVTALLAVALVLSGLLLSRTQGPVQVASTSSTESTPDPAPETSEPAPTDMGPKPVVRSVETVVPKAPVGAAENIVAELPQTRTTSYGMVGVTWSAATTERDITVTIRSLVNQQWTPWQSLELDDQDPNDPGRPGTEPVWVGDAQGVAVRVSSASGTRPADIKVLTIDPGSSTFSEDAAVTPASYRTTGVIDGTARVSSAAYEEGAPTFTPKPAIITRAAWGASAGTTCSAPLTGSSTRGVVVNHTAGTNSYAQSDSDNIVRAIQAYHVQGRGWCDIGYNFLVDKYGQIFEGRKGGMDRSVRGAHSGNGEVNTYAMGVSMMGDHNKVVPSAAVKTAMVRLIGWRMGTTYMKAKGTYAVSENSLTLNRIAGHRNVVSTACPGTYGYAWLSASGGLRDRVESYIGAYASAIKTRAATLGTTVTGPVFVGEADTAGGRKTRFGKVDMYSKSGAGTRMVKADGGFRTKYASFGSQGSALGFPTTDSPSVSTTGTYVQRFEHGSIFAMRSSSATTLHALWGPIATTYATWGETTGKLGTPTSSVFAETAGSRANFKNGYIRYTTATNKAVVYDTSGAVLTTSTTAPSPDFLTIPSTRTIPLRGHGYGHGIGMSQYGAQGAAKSGVTYDKILSTYYPGTAFGTKTGTIRVLITKDTTASVVVGGRSTLTFRKVGGSAVSLPATISGATVAQWRIMPLSTDQTKSTLQYQTTGSWTTYKAAVWTGDAQFEASALRLYLPDSSSVVYRSILRSAIPKAGSTDRNTVNILPIDSYVRGVVSAEMPSSWMPEALKAQAVAARTYGVHGIVATRYYDMCDTTSCQVYRGVAAETTATNSAVMATAGKILTYSGTSAFTQFSSSSGGWTASGGKPYLPSAADSYDNWSGNPVHSWSVSAKASTLEAKYPAIGTLASIKITQRSGGGEWGGRVTTVSLVGSKTTVSISGSAMRAALGLRSTWFALN